MNTQNRVFNAIKKQDKTELREVKKIELGLIQEINKKVDKADSVWKSTNSKVASILKSAADKANSELKELVTLRQDLYGEKQDFQNKAEQLGLDNATMSRYTSKIDTTIKALDKQYEYLKQSIRAIRSQF